MNDDDIIVPQCKHAFRGGCPACDRRDRFAAAALTGLIAYYGNEGETEAARYSTQLADVLIAELDKEQP